jgi:hypothetical protein
VGCIEAQIGTGRGYAHTKRYMPPMIYNYNAIVVLSTGRYHRECGLAVLSHPKDSWIDAILHHYQAH